jgi:RNA polymerase sigma-70 factor, ECF subfamily
VGHPRPVILTRVDHGRPAMKVTRELDPEALGDHIDRLYRAAWSLCGSRQNAEDLVQDTFALVLRKPRFLHSEDDVGYLLRSLRNTFINERRANARRPQTTPMPDEVDMPENLKVGSPELKIESAELYAAISRLPGNFRDARLAIDVVGLSYPEAARALRVREGTVTSRVHRARQRVARELIGNTPDLSTTPASTGRRR